MCVNNASVHAPTPTHTLVKLLTVEDGRFQYTVASKERKKEKKKKRLSHGAAVLRKNCRPIVNSFSYTLYFSPMNCFLRCRIG